MQVPPLTSASRGSTSVEGLGFREIIRRSSTSMKELYEGAKAAI